MPALPRRDPPELWPDMVDAYGLFLALATQWNWTSAGMAGAFRTGLKYEVIKPTAEGLNIPYSPTVFLDLRTLESAALETWSKRRG